MKFQILIPTYNRSKDLQENLRHLRDQLVQYGLTQQFGIAVSDNASTDTTQAMLQELKANWKEDIHLDVLRNEVNVGLEQNSVNLLQFATAEYIIWLGDDDFLAEGYLAFVQEQFSARTIGWMIPGLVGLDKEGNKVVGRPVEFPYKRMTAGYDAVYHWSHLAHQMSGLVVRREGLAETYLARPQWRNPYLFIFFTAYCQLFQDGIYAPSYQTLINNYNPKDWGYNKIGLLDEVFKSYYYLQGELGQKRLNRVLLRFIVMHSYRIDFNQGIGHVVKQCNWIMKSAAEAKGLQIPLLQLLIKEYLIRKVKPAGSLK